MKKVEKADNKTNNIARKEKRPRTCLPYPSWPDCSGMHAQSTVLLESFKLKREVTIQTVWESWCHDLE